MKEHKLFKISQNIVLFNLTSAKVLILEKDGKWLLPGGRLEVGEESYSGLFREVFEEIGIRDFVVSKIWDVRVSDSGDSYIVTFVGKTTVESEIKLSSEHQAYMWVGADDLEGVNFWHPSIYETLKIIIGR